MSDDLRSLGVGEGSKNEAMKLASAHLRGNLRGELASAGTHLTESALQLLKFHGSYQQEDRDQRTARRKAGLEKAYQFMIRSRIPGGVLNAEQYVVHDDLATRYGNATLRLTTRQGIQLHGVLKGDLRAAIAAINGALLSTLAACGDVNRNVMACPAPSHDAARVHAQTFAHRLAEHLAPRTLAYRELWLNGEKIAEHAADVEPMYGETYLPRKFKIGVALSDDNCIDVLTNDIALLAVLDGERLEGFTVAIGGGMGSTHGKVETFARLAEPLCFVTPDEVLSVAEAVVTIQRDYGNRVNRKRARMKYLVEDRGIAWFRSELQARLGRALALPRALDIRGVEDHLGWHEQGDGTWYLGVHVPSGRIADVGAFRLRAALRELVERYRPGVRITPQQNILLTGFQGSARADIGLTLRSHGVQHVPEALGIARYAMACPALPTCGLALAEAERALPDVVAQLQALVDDLGVGDAPLSVRMTGCPNGCARPRMGDIGIVGRSLDSYDVFVGGDWANTRLNVPLASGVQRSALVATLRPLLKAWSVRRASGEAFGDFVARSGLRVAHERAEGASIA